MSTDKIDTQKKHNSIKPPKLIKEQPLSNKPSLWGWKKCEMVCQSWEGQLQLSIRGLSDSGGAQSIYP